MTRKRVVGPLRLNRQNVAVAAAVIEERTEGIVLKGTPFAALPVFGRKLRAALKRRRTNTAEIVMWNVDRDEAEAGFAYLMLFSHEDVPETFLSNAEMDAVHNVALGIAWALYIPRRGPPRLAREEIERRIVAWRNPSTPDVVSDERWVRRLKQRLARNDAVWQPGRRPPITPFVISLLTPRKNTQIRPSPRLPALAILPLHAVTTSLHPVTAPLQAVTYVE